MAEIRTVTTLRRKRDEIRRAVRDYERKLDQARADLAHIAAARAYRTAAIAGASFKVLRCAAL